MEPIARRPPSFVMWGLILVFFDLTALVAMTLGRLIWMDHGIPPSSAALSRMLFGIFSTSSILTAIGLYVCRHQIAAGKGKFYAALGLMTAALFFVAIVVKPIGSVDNYWNTLMSRGWTQYGQNPYLTTPNDLSLDPIFPRTAKEWRGTSMMYGPLWMLFSAIPTFLLTKADAALLGMKALVSAGYIGGGLLLFAYLRRRKNPHANLFLTFWMLNPVGLFEVANAGHNEGLLVLPLAVLAIGLLEKRPRLILSGLTAAVLIKIWPACLLPAALGIKGARRRDWFFGAALSAVMVIVSFAVFWRGWGIFGPLFNRLQEVNPNNLSPGYALMTYAALGPAGGPLNKYIGIVTFLATLAMLMGAGLAGYLAWRGKMSATDATRFIMAVFLLIFLNCLQPWYLLALLPFMLPSEKDADGVIFLMTIAALGIFGFASYIASWAVVTDMSVIMADIAAAIYLSYKARALSRARSSNAAG
jgi:hypothetical protein